SLALSVTATGIPAIIVLQRQGILADVIRAKSTILDFSNLAKYSLMLLVSAISFPAAETVLRFHITAVMGLEAAGLWQALIRLSASYIGFFNVYLAARYLPLLSRTHGSATGKLVLR